MENETIVLNGIEEKEFDRIIFIERPEKIEPPMQEGKVRFDFDEKWDMLFIHAPDVSHPHATIIIKNDEVFIKDMASLEGVYVNGSLIKEAKINCRDNVVIAKRYPINAILLKYVFKKIDPDTDPNDYRKEFLELKKVYENYQMNLKKKRRESLIQRLTVSIILTILMIILYTWVSIPDIYFLVIYIFLMLWLSPILFSFFFSNTEKIQKIEKEYKSEYRCPKCKMMLNQDWDIHREEKFCPRCNAIWSD